MGDRPLAGLAPRETLALAALACAVGLAAPAVAQDPWADRVAAYEPGVNPVRGYADPKTTIGSPERVTGELAGFPGVVSIFNSPFGTDEIVSIGEGGRLVLGFDETIVDDPSHRYGVDLIVFGNAFFLDADWPNGVIERPARVTAEGPMRVSVSADGVDFSPIGDVLEGLFPTQGYLDRGPYDVDPGRVPSDFLRPVDPSLALSDFDGLSFAAALALYDGSGGGIPIDLAGSGLRSARFVMIEVFDDGDPTRDRNVEIDAMAAVPEPASAVLLAGAVAALALSRRGTRARRVRP